MGSFGDAILHCANYRRVCMADNVDAIAAVHIDIFSTVGIPYVPTYAVTDPNGHRSRTRPTGAHTTGHRSLRAIPQLNCFRHSLQERCFFATDYVIKRYGVKRYGVKRYIIRAHRRSLPQLFYVHNLELIGRSDFV